MAIIQIACQGVKWQDDFTPLVSRLERFFAKVFKHWGRDREEVRHNAILLFMTRFAAKWTAGETITLTTNFVVRDVSNGKTFNRRPNQPSVKARSLTGRIRARTMRDDAWVDYRLMLERLEPIQRRMVEMAVEGHALNQIRKELGCGWSTVARTLRQALALLNA